MRDEFLHGHWCATYVNSKISKSTSPFSIDDFMILHKPKKRAQTPQEIRAHLLAWAKAHGTVIPPRKQS